MIQNLDIQIKNYFSECEKKNKSPSIRGLSICLGCNWLTIKRMACGYYNDSKTHLYSDSPVDTRVFANDAQQPLTDAIERINRYRESKGMKKIINLGKRGYLHYENN